MFAMASPAERRRRLTAAAAVSVLASSDTRPGRSDRGHWGDDSLNASSRTMSCPSASLDHVPRALDNPPILGATARGKGGPEAHPQDAQRPSGGRSPQDNRAG